MTELWRPVHGWEGYYEVSDHGRVRSLSRRVSAGRGRTRISAGRVLSLSIAGRYYGVHLSRDGRPHLHPVHVLVAKAFLELNTLDVLHTNGDYLDNRSGNLRYGTKSENAYDSVEHGTHFNASKTHCKHGHEFTPNNTYLKPVGGRECRICRDRHQSNRKLRERAAA